jgi:YD repeat-containing protein
MKGIRIRISRFAAALFAALFLGATSVMGSAVSYTYDSLNRLTNVDNGNGLVMSYTYDPAGNRLSARVVGRQLTIVATGPGTITSSPSGIDCGGNCTASFLSGTSVTLSITAATGWYISDINIESWRILWQLSGGWPLMASWSGAINMDQDTTVTVSFARALIVTTIGSGTVSASPDGLSCGPPCIGLYTNGATVTLTPIPSQGAVFLGWSGDASGTGNCTLDMSQNHSVTATFTTANYTLNTVFTGSGAITSSPAGINCGGNCSASYLDGTSVTLSIMAAAGWYISDVNIEDWQIWRQLSGGCSGPSTNLSDMANWSGTIAISQNTTVTVAFAHALLVTTTGSGAVSSTPEGLTCGPPCLGFFTGPVTLTATPSPGAQFLGWSGDASGTGDCTLDMSPELLP